MKTIDIYTTQNVTIEYELASLRDRFLAFFIDLIIVFSIYYLLIIFLLSTAQNAFTASFIGARMMIGFFCSFMFYQFVSEILANGQSWGKKSIGIKVVRVDGKEAGLSEYFLRAIFHIVDTIFSLGIIGALLISSSSKNQRLGDITSNTTVIRTRNATRFRLDDILSINTLENYEPQYPEVKKLSERDMLLIKETLNRYRTYNNQAHRKAVVELVNKVTPILGIDAPPKNRLEFLRILIRDYIVLTR